MNKVILVGRLTRDVELKYTQGENANANTRFSIAVNRSFKNANGAYEADFPNCVAWGKTAEFINKFFHKGDMIGIVGNIRTGSYTNKEGIKVYTTDVYVDSVEFVGSKNSGTNDASDTHSNTRPDMSFMDIPDSGDEAPFPFK